MSYLPQGTTQEEYWDQDLALRRKAIDAEETSAKYRFWEEIISTAITAIVSTAVGIYVARALEKQR